MRLPTWDLPCTSLLVAGTRSSDPSFYSTNRSISRLVQVHVSVTGAVLGQRLPHPLSQPRCGPDLHRDGPRQQLSEEEQGLASKDRAKRLNARADPDTIKQRGQA